LVLSDLLVLLALRDLSDLLVLLVLLDK